MMRLSAEKMKAIHSAIRAVPGSTGIDCPLARGGRTAVSVDRGVRSGSRQDPSHRSQTKSCRELK